MSDVEATPRGKIGRLPHGLREAVNGMLRDHATAEDIITFLATKGVEGITPQNVTNWKQNGFEKWLRNRERIDGLREQIEFARSLAKADQDEGIDGLTVASDAAARVAVGQIMTALESFSPAHLAEMMADKPAKFMELVHALAAMRRGDQEAAKLKMKLDAFHRAYEQLVAATEKTGTASSEDIKGFFAEAYGVKT